MCKFEENVQKPDFWAKNGQIWQKLAVFGQNLENENFFSKIRLEHFFSLAKMQLWAKFQKNLMRGSPDIASRTNERTNGRTHERESIPSANAETKKRVFYTALKRFLPIDQVVGCFTDDLLHVVQHESSEHDETSVVNNELIGTTAAEAGTNMPPAERITISIIQLCSSLW